VKLKSEKESKAIACYLLLACFLLSLFFDSEDSFNADG
jgi:hypothetical protein